MRRVGKKQLLVGLLSASMVVGSAMPAFAAEWKRDNVGWWYEEDNGQYPTATWRFINNEWYYFQVSGYMSTGWIYEGGRWYFANSDGAMQTGWVVVDGKAYYLNTVSDGTKGAMYTGTATIDGVTYTFDETGACTSSAPVGTVAYYGNGTRVTGNGPSGVQATSGEAIIIENAISSGGRPSGSGSNSTVTKTWQEEVREAVVSTISKANASENVGNGKQILSVFMADGTTEIRIAVNPEMLDQEIDHGTSEGIIVELADAVVDVPVDKVKVQGRQFDSASDARDALVSQLAYRKLGTLNNNYTVVLTKGTETETYTIKVDK